MEKPILEECKSSTEEITIRIPCVLAERIAAYAEQVQASIQGVVIEALDFFLRQREPK